MKTKTDRPDTKRRDFLKLASVSAPAAVAAVAVTGGEAEAATSSAEAGSVMQDTAHTRAYFDSVRF